MDNFFRTGLLIAAPTARAAERNSATAHLFIVNPLSGAHLDRLFSTHPPVEERIARLPAMAQVSPWGAG